LKKKHKCQIRFSENCFILESRWSVKWWTKKLIIKFSTGAPRLSSFSGYENHYSFSKLNHILELMFFPQHQLELEQWIFPNILHSKLP
jgi:hypothetical protein